MTNEYKFELIVKLKKKKIKYKYRCRTKEEVLDIYKRIQKRYGRKIQFRKVIKLKPKWNGIMEAITFDGYTFRGDDNGIVLEKSGRKCDISWKKFTMLIRETPAIVDWTRVVSYFVKRPRLFKDILDKDKDIINVLKLKKYNRMKLAKKREDKEDVNLGAALQMAVN